MLFEVAGSETREAAKKFIGKTVVWKTPAGIEMTGKVTAAHGNTGAIHAHFKPGLPGQAIGAEVELK
ncbi:MAG TPA: 50S ribosomal protein L35ae [Candidatus Nanoarchaeia archaeon]|nr:50S ribosomal protein L35ae [Candidatus Nanoarchaeia archaeon]